MATTVNIGGAGSLFVGEDKAIRLLVNDPATGDALDITGWTILFDVRKTDKDPTAIFSIIATISGAFSATPAMNTQRAVVVLTDDQLNTVSAKTYRYSFKRMDAGSETVLARGDFAPEKATAP